MIFDVAVVIPTTLQPTLAEAVRSVYSQDLAGNIQILVGIDMARGSREILGELEDECPKRMSMSVVDLGYSTSARHGGFYPNWSGGALRTILSYAANSRYVAYLDDDNWWAPAHLSDLVRVLTGVDYAYSYRWYVDPASREPMCIDEWESVGPGRGIYARQFNGFVDTNCLMLDKRRCHWMIPAWCVPGNRKGAGADRVVFDRLQAGYSGVCTGNATAYYVIREADIPRIRHLVTRKVSAGGAE